MVDVAAEDFVDGSQGVGVGDVVVIQSRTEEVAGGVGQEELHGRGSIALQVIIDPIDAGIGVTEALFGYSVRLDGVVKDHTDAFVSEVSEGG